MGLLALVVGDMHGQLKTLWYALEKEKPELLICTGDWGDPGQIDPSGYHNILEQVPVYSVYGNHDDLTLLRTLKNRDGSPVLLPHGDVVELKGIRLAGISGIWAKSHKKPYYITDEEVIEVARKLAGKSVTVLVTHGCPVGLADETPKGTHGGQKCFLDAFKIVNPKAHLCGHLHKPQLRELKSGQLVLNVGTTASGDYAVLELEPEKVSIVKRVTASTSKELSGLGD
ncbi:MAG: metallophosphoesterase [Armatimonadetes bacterium]|nr:metallophosphoesterase [Armatimonadota bacterium]MCX7969220.1 metallophosphoesterase [Armatimonadota bacterium]MDW8143469.1 metallophosphoesterase [Armatimonadota bacterium]